MTYAQLIRHYGSLTRAAQALELSKQTVNYWKDAKRIPDRWQLEIASKTPLQVDAQVKRRAKSYAAVMPMLSVQEPAP
jgi:hypothetical protein